MSISKQNAPGSTDAPAKGDPFYEYLEKYVADGIKRELDQEEAVWRSIPAFITALGLLGAMLAYLGSKLVPVQDRFFSNLALVVAVIGSVCLLVAGWNLRLAVRPRRYGYPSDEEGVVRAFQERRQYYENQGMEPSCARSQVLKDFRPDLLEKTAAAASVNHRSNSQKLAARTRAAHWLFFAAAFTFVAAAVTLFDYETHEAEQNHDGYTSAAAPAAAASTPSADTLGRKRPNESSSDPLGRSPRTEDRPSETDGSPF